MALYGFALAGRRSSRRTEISFTAALRIESGTRNVETGPKKEPRFRDDTTSPIVWGIEMKWIMLQGSIGDGFSARGPFDSRGEALTFAARHYHWAAHTCVIPIWERDDEDEPNQDSLSVQSEVSHD